MKYLLGFTLIALMYAVTAGAGEVTVSDAWARATAPGQDSGSIQFSITSLKQAELVGASSPLAGAVEFHSMSHENGMMEMRRIDAIELPAGKTVDLASSGKHMMLIGLKRPLKAGERIPFAIKVHFADNSAETTKASAEVISLTAARETDHQDMKNMPDMPGM